VGDQEDFWKCVGEVCGDRVAKDIRNEVEEGKGGIEMLFKYFPLYKKHWMSPRQFIKLAKARGWKTAAVVEQP
jgi:hypothetical protein